MNRTISNQPVVVRNDWVIFQISILAEEQKTGGRMAAIEWKNSVTQPITDTDIDQKTTGDGQKLRRLRSDHNLSRGGETSEKTTDFFRKSFAHSERQAARAGYKSSKELQKKYLFEAKDLFYPLSKIWLCRNVQSPFDKSKKMIDQKSRINRRTRLQRKKLSQTPKSRLKKYNKITKFFKNIHFSTIFSGNSPISTCSKKTGKNSRLDFTGIVEHSQLSHRVRKSLKKCLKKL